MTKLALMLVLAVALSTSVLADSIYLSYPPEGATVDINAQELTFSTDSGEVVTSCAMLLNNASLKNIAYNKVIKGLSLSTKMVLDDGAYTWQVRCDTPKGSFLSPVRTFTAKASAAPQVTVTSSGTFRGSMLRSFTIANNAKQAPVVIEKVAPGDYLGITFSIPPSKIKKELYVKQFGSKDNRKFALLRDEDNDETYNIFLGERITINIKAYQILLEYRANEFNKGTFVAHPILKDAPESPIPPEPSENPEETPGPSEEVDDAPKPPTVVPPSEPEPPKAPVTPKQGVVKRFLTWFANIFG